MQTVVSLASVRMGLTPAEARGVGPAARAGSLETRKDADRASLNVDDYRDLADNAGTNLVYMTITGVIIYREGGVIAPGAVK